MIQTVDTAFTGALGKIQISILCLVKSITYIVLRCYRGRNLQSSMVSSRTPRRTHVIRNITDPLMKKIDAPLRPFAERFLGGQQVTGVRAVMRFAIRRRFGRRNRKLYILRLEWFRSN